MFMQVKHFGRTGRMKSTNLVNEGTTDWNNLRYHGKSRHQPKSHLVVLSVCTGNDPDGSLITHVLHVISVQA
ncbi:hypothetical protein GUJ93_ZPchr0006g45343 [Zizania palustris]|uniref:Uncharacterized protein n=1 Tax=Zizania palustris TaxID=103762 RepID=A0A8J5W3E2_ZIZPA|nr:hypothetical protein GUJ93_ZPchr0006g45343 [Zizania palustris]